MNLCYEVLTASELVQRWPILSDADRKLVAEAKERGLKIEVAVLRCTFGNYIHALSLTEIQA